MERSFVMNGTVTFTELAQFLCQGQSRIKAEDLTEIELRGADGERILCYVDGSDDPITFHTTTHVDEEE